MKKNHSVKSQIDEIVDKVFKNYGKQQFLPGKTPVKYAGMVFDKKDVYSAVEALLSSFSNNWFALGENATQFQHKLANYLGIKRTVFVNSGSSANLVSVATLAAKKRIKAGDEAITIATTFPTTLNPLIIYGLKPVVVDVELPSYTANLDELEKVITKKTKLIMLPHINGSPHDMQRIMEIAKKHDLAVIEDCCDALGSKYDGKMVGTYGDLGTYSFYAAHHMSTGEGGAVGGNDDLLSTAESIRDWGRVNLKSTSLGLRKISLQNVSNDLPDDYEDRYTYVNMGYNLKPLDMQAALGIKQLEKIDKFNVMRKHNYEFLFENISDLTNDLILPQGLPKSDPSWFVFPITIKNNAKFKRIDIVKFFEEKKIETRTLLAGDITMHPAYQDIAFRKSSKLPITKEILQKSFVIGVYQGLGKEELGYIIECFKKFLKHY